VLVSVAVLDDVEGLVALLEAVLDERQQHAILLVLAVEEGANVTGATKNGTRKSDFFAHFFSVALRAWRICTHTPYAWHLYVGSVLGDFQDLAVDFDAVFGDTTAAANSGRHGFKVL
jgi:hypothetical protein